jgi:hypothetical protein
MTTHSRTSSLAIVSLVAGLLGWTFAPWLGSIIAIITGHMARAEIRSDPEGVDGDGLAIAGLALGWSMVALSAFTVFAIVLFFGGLAAFIAFLATLSA